MLASVATRRAWVAVGVNHACAFGAADEMDALCPDIGRGKKRFWGDAVVQMAREELAKKAGGRATVAR